MVTSFGQNVIIRQLFIIDAVIKAIDYVFLNLKNFRKHIGHIYLPMNDNDPVVQCMQAFGIITIQLRQYFEDRPTIDMSLPLYLLICHVYHTQRHSYLHCRPSDT